MTRTGRPRTRPLMIGAFFGTVIIERAVALGRGWGYFTAAGGGSGGILLLVRRPLIGLFLLAAGG